MTERAGRSAKAEQTRRAIVEAALRLFRDHGFDGTTMRAIAGEAGVSLGSAYYYFAAKEHLIHGFYDQLQDDHAARVESHMVGLTSFSARLLVLLEDWVDVAAPYHEFAGTFFKNAAEPTSPLSPFSEESGPARVAAVGLFAQVLDGSDLKVAPALRAELPELLWLLQMGVVLFWVYDRSPDQARTRELVRRVVPLVDQLARLTRLPLVRGVTNDLVALVRSLRDAPGSPDAEK